MIKNGTKKEAAIMLSTVIILSFYLKRLQKKKKNMEHVRCQGSLPTPFHPDFRVKDTVLRCFL
jgi:hypothetical protein